MDSEEGAGKYAQQKLMTCEQAQFIAITNQGNRREQQSCKCHSEGGDHKGRCILLCEPDKDRGGGNCQDGGQQADGQEDAGALFAHNCTQVYCFHRLC